MTIHQNYYFSKFSTDGTKPSLVIFTLCTY